MNQQEQDASFTAREQGASLFKNKTVLYLHTFKFCRRSPLSKFAKMYGSLIVFMCCRPRSRLSDCYLIKPIPNLDIINTQYSVLIIQTSDHD